MKMLKVTLSVVNTIETEFPDKSSSVFMADWELFQQALFHPLVNAIKFNKPRGTI